MKLALASVAAAWVVALAAPAPLFADEPAGGPAAASEGAPVIVHGGGGKPSLVLAREGGALVVRACKDPKRCDGEGTVIKPPAAARDKQPRIEPLAVGGGRAVAQLAYAGEAGASFLVLLAAKDDGVELLWKGWPGPAGALATTKEGASVRVVKTERAQLCGREVELRRARLDAAKLAWIDEAVADPLGAQRASAEAIPARVEEAAEGRHPLLVAQQGSAPGLAARLVDGELAGGLAGPARSVAIFAAPDVPVAGLDLAFGPGTLPGAVFVVTDARTFEVRPAAGAPGEATWHGVSFAAPLRSRCLAVVVDAPPGKPAKNGDPGSAALVELAARSPYDRESLDEVAAGLGRAGEEGKARAAFLSALGAPGLAATAKAYAKLDGPGRDLARRVIDPAPCEERVRFYAGRLTDKDLDESNRARDRLRRCPEAAGAALLGALDQAELPELQATFAEEAALIAPAAVVPELVRRLDKAESSETRRPFRRGLAKAASRAAGVKALDAALGDEGFAKLALATRVDVLRALGAGAQQAKNAPAALAAATADAKDFREQYLLLGPAGEIARGGDAAAASSLRAALGAGDHRLRARAAEASWGVAALEGDLVAALADAKVRVRAAALDALIKRAGDTKLDKPLAGKLVQRLKEDPWTFVRASAAGALAVAAADPAIDAELGAAVDLEESPRVRAELLQTLGARAALPQAETIRSRAFDGKETVEVRTAAIGALGAICDRGATDGLTEIAVRGRVPLFELDRKLAAVAVSALARLRPADLEKRLAPLLDEGAVPDIRDVAKKAVKSPATGTCGGR